LRCVFDTNALVSALLLPDSNPRQALDIVLRKGKVLLSFAALAELYEVLSRKQFRRYIDEQDIRSYLAALMQTHYHTATKYMELYSELATRCDLRFHISVESDRDRLPGLPRPASSVAKRLQAAKTLKAAGLRVVITVSPLLPIREPCTFFQRIADVADAVVIDHFIEGDGTPNGSRTMKTALPDAMSAVDPHSIDLEYRDQMIGIAQEIMPGRVGVNVDGFAGCFLPPP
jgi:DNA repair photolyase